MITVDHIQESEWRRKRKGNIEIYGCFPHKIKEF
jgi:hypothetical protein